MIFCNGADIGVDTDGWVGGQVSTANRLVACWIGNCSIAGGNERPNWIGWRVFGTATNNNEYMIARRNTFYGGTTRHGYGFAMPNASSSIPSGICWTAISSSAAPAASISPMAGHLRRADTTSRQHL